MPNQADSAAGQNFDKRVIDVVIRLGFLGLLAYWAGLIIGPFVVIVIWSGILTVAILPVYNWLKNRLGGKGGLSSTVITLVLLGIILGPAGALSTSVLESAQGLSTELQDGALDIPPPKESVKEWPVIGEKVYAAWALAEADLDAFLAQHSERLTSIGRKLLSGVAGIWGGVLSFAVSIVIAGFMYGRSAAIGEAVCAFAERVIVGKGREFMQMSGATIRNVARGVLGVSLIQAVLAGIGLIAGGVPAAGVLALLILILGILQAPPTLVIIPAIIWMWSDAEFLAALIFTIYMIPVALLDNFLKPILMAKGLKTPMLVIFIGVIGGTLAHGLMGLFLGPVILAVFYDLLTAWVTGEMQTSNESNAAEPETT